MIFYRLVHIHHNNGYKQELYIGTFQSLSMIREVVLLLKDQVGFKNFSIDSFIVKKIILNDYSYWENGFQTLMEELDIPL